MGAPMTAMIGVLAAGTARNKRYAAARAWITFRDSECRYLTQQDVSARGYGALVRGCLVEPVEERTEELREAEAVLAAR
jgi:uncharacterized protein YecT (DUF1311 family)